MIVAGPQIMHCGSLSYFEVNEYIESVPTYLNNKYVIKR